MAEPTLECIRLAQRGEPSAVAELITSQQQYVYSIAMSVLHNPEDAADLTQEAFMRLLRVLPQYNGESRFTTWLYRMVVNLGRDELRRRGRQVPVAGNTSDDSDEQNPMNTVADDDRWGDPARALGDHELQGAVRRALAQIEPHYRLALTLFYFDDMKYADIAEVLDLPLNTVKSHIRRGKERLQTLLNEYDDTPTPLPAQPAMPARSESRSVVRPSGTALIRAGV
ncbi:MAG: sigma-70 family RNA polymerase sigma factor [Herpetosiphon sp.]